MSANVGHPAIKIRDITDLAEMRAVEELQKEIWGVEDREVFPALAMRPITAVGGILIGAFDGDRLVGFVFGFPGIEQGQATLHSDMLAVKAEYRSQGLGYQLKLAQREHALNKGISTITWTFDPLQAANAHLNFARLGVVADRYLVNFYGETTSFLHQAGTDRLWLTWFLDSPRVKERLETPFPSKSGWVETASPNVLVSVGHNEDPIVLDEEPAGDRVIIEIPGDINRLLSYAPDVALQWRQVTRRAFQAALTAGYSVAEFDRLQRSEMRIGRYLLRAKTEFTLVNSRKFV